MSCVEQLHVGDGPRVDGGGRRGTGRSGCLERDCRQESGTGGQYAGGDDDAGGEYAGGEAMPASRSTWRRKEDVAMMGTSLYPGGLVGRGGSLFGPERVGVKRR